MNLVGGRIIKEQHFALACARDHSRRERNEGRLGRCPRGADNRTEEEGRKKEEGKMYVMSGKPFLWRHTQSFCPDWVQKEGVQPPTTARTARSELRW